MKKPIIINDTPFSRGVRSFLKRKKLTQAALASKVYVSSAAVSSWSTGRNDPSVTIALLALEGMTLTELFGKEVVDRLIANEREFNNELLAYMFKKTDNPSKPVNPQKPDKPAVPEKKKTGFISHLVSLFSAKR